MEREKPGEIRKWRIPLCCFVAIPHPQPSTLHRFLALALSRTIARTEAARIAQFGSGRRSRACIFQEFGWTSSMLRDVLVVLLWPAWCSHLSSPMQMRDAMQLQKKWKKRGNLPCRHPHVQHEYYYDTPTGAMVCTTCGSTVTFKDVEKSRRIEAVSR